MSIIDLVHFSINGLSRKRMLVAGLIVAHTLALPAFVFVRWVGESRYFAFFIVMLFGLALLDISLLVSDNENDRRIAPSPFPARVLDLRVLTTILATCVVAYTTIGIGLLFYLVMTLFFVALLVRASIIESTKDFLESLLLVTGGSFLLIIAQISSVPYFHRTGDTIYHTALTLRIARSHFIGAASPGRYENLPVFHTVMASIGHVADVQSRLFIGIVVAVLFQVAIVSVYLLLRKFNESPSSSLTGAALIGISPPFLVWGVKNHAQSLSFVFLTVFLLVLVSRFNDRRNTVISVGIIGTWVLTHQLSPLIAIVLIGVPVWVLYGYSFVRRTPFEQEIKTSFVRLLILVVTLLTYWTIVTRIMQEPIWWIFSISPSAQGIESRGYLVVYHSDFGSLVRSSIPEIVDKLHYGVWLGIAAVGAWTFVRTVRRSDKYRLVAILAFVPAAIFFFPNPTWVVLEGLVLRGRWEIMALPFVILLPTMAVRRLLSGGQRPAKNVMAMFVVVFLVFMSIGGGMTTPNVTELAGYEKRSTRTFSETDFAAIEYSFAYTNDTPVYGTIPIPVYMRYYDWRYRHVPGPRQPLLADLEQREIRFAPGLNIVQTKPLREGRAKMVVSTDPPIRSAVSEDMVSINETRGSRVFDAAETEIYAVPPRIDA